MDDRDAILPWPQRGAGSRKLAERRERREPRRPELLAGLAGGAAGDEAAAGARCAGDVQKRGRWQHEHVGDGGCTGFAEAADALVRRDVPHPHAAVDGACTVCGCPCLPAVESTTPFHAPMWNRQIPYLGVLRRMAELLRSTYGGSRGCRSCLDGR